MADITEQEIDVFVEAINQYFSKITGKKVEIHTSFLMEETNKSPQFNEFTGVITVSGEYYGCIYFSASRIMLTRLLLEMNETDYTNAQLLDVVGEVANTLAGNARRYFGEAMEISVPITFQGAPKQLDITVLKRPYIIIINWRQYLAEVVVDIAKK